MDSKKVLEKLVKIAENQQKIINKLAQEAGLVPTGGATDTWEDVSTPVADMLSKLPGAMQAQVGLSFARVAPQSGALDGRLKVNQVGDPKVAALMKQLSQSLAGQTLTSTNGKQVKVSQNPADIKFIAET